MVHSSASENATAPRPAITPTRGLTTTTRPAPGVAHRVTNFRNPRRIILRGSDIRSGMVGANSVRFEKGASGGKRDSSMPDRGPMAKRLSRVDGETSAS